MAIVALALGVYIVAIVSVPPKGGAMRAKRVKQRSKHTAHIKKKRGLRRELDMGLMLTEVATRLRSGASVEGAWKKTLQHSRVQKIAKLSPEEKVLDDSGVPVQIRKLWAMNRFARWRAGVTPVAADSLPATIAVCRMGHETGAPMAEILDFCALGVIEASEARSARDVAIAGPQSSAHMLAVLPIVGIALGYVMGADPFNFLLHSVFGHIALAAGIALEIGGILMVNRLVAQAKQEVD